MLYSYYIVDELKHKKYNKLEDNFNSYWVTSNQSKLLIYLRNKEV